MGRVRLIILKALLMMGCNPNLILEKEDAMRKLLFVVALFALAAGFAFGYTQSLGTAGDEVIGYDRDVLGEGTATGDEAFVYAKFTLTGIEFQVIDLGDVSCGGDVGTAGHDVWVLTAVTSNDDIAQYASTDIPFVIENRGALALDLGIWNSTPEGISSGDDWDLRTATEHISSALNAYRLFGVFAEGSWAPGNETAVKTECVADNAHWIGTTLAWYTDGTHFSPTSTSLDVYNGKTNLDLPAACGTIGTEDVLDYCQFRMRWNVGEGGSDQYGHAFQITLVSRITEG